MHVPRLNKLPRRCTKLKRHLRSHSIAIKYYVVSVEPIKYLRRINSSIYFLLDLCAMVRVTLVLRRDAQAPRQLWDAANTCHCS